MTPFSIYQILDSTDDARFIDTLNRPVLAQTFGANLPTVNFTIAVNHLKSKGSDCLDVGGCQFGRRAGQLRRYTAAAQAASTGWPESTASGDGDFLIVGDLSTAKEDPITAIISAGYTNLIERFGGADAYGYVFDGQWGYLDHALASPTLDLQVTGTAEYHINADELAKYSTTTPTSRALAQITDLAPDEFRTADHDPVIGGPEPRFKRPNSPSSLIRSLITATELPLHR
ncbi:MAG: hypothetical protein R2856_39595 [Caldilineaceae bacterium]